ncbi:hypothetical protein ACFYKX_25605 [Cytobacillus sp. FJAT-54145]|uniref:Uncharacterized protein n=1 Tax=Cytobacillus spartinae TaxID=3299023 RepID=A0ABW6KM96_9BACI
MIVKKIGAFKIVKDGTTYYRVFKGRKRVASFLFLYQAENFVENNS